MIDIMFSSSLAIDPLISLPFIYGIGGLAVIAAIIAGLGRLRSFMLRLFAALALIAGLLNPQTVIEEREPLNDAVLVLRDQSGSMALGNRPALAQAGFETLIETLNAQPNLDVTTAIIPPDSDGTRLGATLIDQLSNLPASRLAGIITLTDGQVHDLPEQADALLPNNVPFHALIIGDAQSRDRRIIPSLAPQYGLVGDQVDFEVMVEDPGHEGERANIEIKLNGVAQARFGAIIGDRVSIPIKIERRGVNTVELLVEAADGELTVLNNVFISEISGIRDRLRVLLVTGFPHNGGRAWRNLLKSDPSVDLVQFTILTNPRIKRVNANSRDLSLISFPVRQLFEDKLDEFDLIIFDHFKRRFTPGPSGRATPILQPYYLQNIAEYVESGGALLVATGPAFAGDESLFRSPLAAVLPARPTGKMAETAFKPQLNEKGRRHPITAPFADKDDKTWGRWFRLIENNIVSGNVLMEGPEGEPLLVIEKVGEGRVGMLLSDQAWLWAKGYDGGGPYSEMFRRLSHWLMGEPDLDAEKLSARLENGALSIERRSLSDGKQTIRVQKPDGSEDFVTLNDEGNGVFRASVPAHHQGAYRLSSGDISTIAAAGALNPKEFSELRATDSLLRPLSDATGGLTHFTKANGRDIPAIRRTKSGRQSSGDSWMGLVNHEQFVVQDSRRAPLLPGLVFFVLSALTMGLAWWREGR